MAFQYPNNRVPTTKDGIPYVWGGGDTTTVPSNELKLVHPNPVVSDSLTNGRNALAIGCGKIVAGSYNDDDAASNGGVVHVWNLDGTGHFTITASDPSSSDYFGYSVAIDEKYQKIIVGAYLWDGTISNQGRVYIYDIDGTNEVAIDSPVPLANGYFGQKVVAGNGIAVVGDYRATISTDTDAGQVVKINLTDYSTIYDQDPTGSGLNDQYGSEVAVGNNRIVATNPREGATDFGHLILYDSNLNFLKQIDNPFPASNDQFGEGQLAIGSGRIVVGSNLDNPDGVADQGSVYVYDLNGNYVGECEQPDPSADDQFGHSVDVGYGRIVVGAYAADENANGSGCAYVYDLDCNFITKLIGSDTVENDNFGYAVAIGNGKIAVSARNADAGVENSGAIYVYDTPYNYTMHDALEYHKGEK
jgi:hypothetical protein